MGWPQRMKGITASPSGRTLGDGQGSPRLRRLTRHATIARSWTAPTLLLVALALSVLAVAAAWTSLPTSAVRSRDATVLWVLPDGPSWASGVRPGQEVLEHEPPDHPEEWRMRTRTASGTTVATKTSMIATLRATEPLAALGLVAALSATGLLRRRPAAAAALAVVAVVAARPALLATGDLTASSLAVAAALLVPGIWLLAWSPRRWIGWSAAALALGATAAWLLLRMRAAGDPTMSELWDGWSAAVAAFTWLLTAGVILWSIAPTMRARGGGYDPRRIGDIAVVGGVLVAAPIAVLLDVPVLSALVLVLLVMVVYPLTRRRIGAALDRLMLGEIRTRSSVAAIERERERVSREIHDQPLQELATVIHRLARRPELVEETIMLQQVSGHLRGVTTQLHPPILTDLGLGPALEALAADVRRTATMGVEASVDVAPAGRPPEEIELAAYRIAQEALTNAIRHSAARHVVLDASIAAGRVVVTVADDGVGLDGVAMGGAIARGRMGLRSMAERAELIRADLRFEDARPGTRVTFRWPS